MMNTYLDRDSWNAAFAGFEITDVAVRTSTVIQLCLKKSVSQYEASYVFDQQIPSRIISLATDRPDGVKYGLQELEGMSYPVVGVSRDPVPRPCGLLASRSMGGDVWPLGGGSGPLEKIAPGRFVATKRLKCINGHAYAVGIGRSVFKRVDVGSWIPVENGFPDVEVTESHGFNDIDAFSESDMYAVGGHGDVWHYDGATWTQLGFPSNVQLATVTCATDGNVYISGEGGSLWAGVGSTWKQLYKGTSSILWNDAVWFQDRLWLASDYQLRQWNGKALVPVAHESNPVLISGHMDAYEGVLAIASPNEVLLFDGSAWRTLVSPYA